ncbi:hypothetical protein BS78_05G198400 [Paspalum vaginatum]|nr:hypothetical protein BS78_05G198400 [Paspalum vaginatum]
MAECTISEKSDCNYFMVNLDLMTWCNAAGGSLRPPSLWRTLGRVNRVNLDPATWCNAARGSLRTASTCKGEEYEVWNRRRRRMNTKSGIVDGDGYKVWNRCRSGDVVQCRQ